ncbi:MAG: gephyrin-like molybdotransferase Glp [Gammaproteobacteria bacterium]
MTDPAPNHQPSCADPGDPGMLSVPSALDAILAAIAPVDGSESIALGESLGRVLAADVVSGIDVPGHTNAAVDGFALAAADLPSEGGRLFTIAGTAYAGPATDRVCPPGECIRVMTGAAMPGGTDTAIMREHVEETTDGRVRIGPGHSPSQNVRQAGEDIARGATVFAAGHKLAAADLGVLASLGVANPTVRPLPKVAFFSTGDELRAVGENLGDGEIYDSNRYTLHALLEQAGVETIDLGVVRDDPDALRQTLTDAASRADLVITSGGVSVGDADYIKPVLSSLGDMHFWKIAMKPGRPLTFGRIGGTLFFGLPGNPVAVMVTFLQFVRPALQVLSGGEHVPPLLIPARCVNRLRKKPGRTEYVRAIVFPAADGTLSVRSTGSQGSGVLTSMSRANAFIVLAPEQGSVEAGEMVRVQLFSGLV